MAQAPRTGYHVEGLATSHILNPAFQPDSGYVTLPLLGNTSFSWMSSMKLGNLIYERPGGKLTTFMSQDVVTKSELMDNVGSGLANNIDACLTILSVGKRVNKDKYRTFELSFKGSSRVFAPKDLFRLIKDVENGAYDLKGMSIRETAYLEAAFGESKKVNEKLSVGGKAKVLLGLINADVNVKNLNVNVQDGNQWTVNADIETNLFGLDYKTKKTDYKSKPGQFEQVNSVKSDGMGLKGVGVAIDAGAVYKYDDCWTFSAAVLDLGFISWFKGHKATNTEKDFVFDGFQDLSTDKSDPNSLKNQGDKLQDDLMAMAHLEKSGDGSLTRMLGCTIEGAASYKKDCWTFGGLASANICGDNSWFEARANVGYSKIKNLDLVLSPAYNTYGVCLGGMVSYRPGRWQFFLAGDNILTQFTKQFLPTANTATVQFGVAMPL